MLDYKLATDESDKKTESESVKVGRPTICIPELAQKICEIVSTTSKGLGKIIQENPWMPAEATILRWNRENEEFRLLFSRAKEDQIKKHLDFTVEIADEAAQKVEDKDINAMRVSAVVQAAKLRTETREKYAQLLMPTRFGAKAVIKEEKDENAELTDAEKVEKVRQIFGVKKD